MGRGRQLQGQPHVASAFSTVVQHSIYSTTVGSLLEQCWNNTYSTHHCIQYVQYTYVQYSTFSQSSYPTWTQ